MVSAAGRASGCHRLPKISSLVVPLSRSMVQARVERWRSRPIRVNASQIAISPVAIRVILDSLGLRIISRITIRQYDPWLPTAGPEVDGRSHPGRIIERPSTYDSDHGRRLIASPWISANPYAAVRANQAPLDASAVCHALHGSCCPQQANCLSQHHNADRKCATGDALAIGAVACVYCARRLSDLIADRAA